MSQDVSPGFRCTESLTVHLGDKNTPGLHPGAFSAVPAGLNSVDNHTQDSVLGYSQPSLRDSIWRALVSCEYRRSVLRPAAAHPRPRAARAFSAAPHNIHSSPAHT